MVIAALVAGAAAVKDLYCSSADSQATFHGWSYAGGAMPPPTMVTQTQFAWCEIAHSSMLNRSVPPPFPRTSRESVSRRVRS